MASVGKDGRVVLCLLLLHGFVGWAGRTRLGLLLGSVWSFKGPWVEGGWMWRVVVAVVVLLLVVSEGEYVFWVFSW